METHANELLPILLTNLHDPNDEVVLQGLQVLAEIIESTNQKNDDQTQNKYKSFLEKLMQLFSKNRDLLDQRGTLIIR